MPGVSPIGAIARNTGLQHAALQNIAANQDSSVRSALTGAPGGDLTSYARAATVYSIARDSIPFWIQVFKNFLAQLKSFNSLAFGNSQGN